MAEGSGQHELEITVKMDFTAAEQQAEQFRQQQESRPITFGGGGTSGGAALGTAAEGSRIEQAINNARTEVDRRRALTPSAGDDAVRVSTMRGWRPFDATQRDYSGDVTQADQLRGGGSIYGPTVGRYQTLERYGDTREFAYENRIAADKAREERGMAQNEQRFASSSDAADFARFREERKQVSGYRSLFYQTRAQLAEDENARFGATYERGIRAQRQIANEEDRAQTIRAREYERDAAGGNTGAAQSNRMANRFAILFATRELAQAGVGFEQASNAAITASSFAQFEQSRVMQARAAAQFAGGIGALSGFALGGLVGGPPGAFIGAAIGGFGSQTAGSIAAGQVQAAATVDEQTVADTRRLTAARLQTQNIEAFRAATGAGGTSAGAIAVREAARRTQLLNIGNELGEVRGRLADLPLNPTDRLAQREQFTLYRRETALRREAQNVGEASEFDIQQTDRQRNLGILAVGTINLRNQQIAEGRRGRAADQELSSRAIFIQASQYSQQFGNQVGDQYQASATAAFEAGQNRARTFERQTYRVDVAESAFRGRGDTFGASLVRTFDDALKVVANADPDSRLGAIAAGSARVGALISDTRRQNIQESNRYEAQAESARAQARGDNLEARLIQIKASRDAALSSPLLNNPIVNAFGFGAGLRGSINNAANAAIDLERFRDQQRDESLFIQRDVTGLQAQGRPFGAQIEQIAREAQRRSRDESGDAKDAILQTGVNQEMELRRQLLFGGRPEEITSGTFKGGAGEGNPQIEEQTSLLQRIAEAIEKLVPSDGS